MPGVAHGLHQRLRRSPRAPASDRQGGPRARRPGSPGAGRHRNPQPKRQSAGISRIRGNRQRRQGWPSSMAIISPVARTIAELPERWQRPGWDRLLLLRVARFVSALSVSRPVAEMRGSRRAAGRGQSAVHCKGFPLGPECFDAALPRMAVAVEVAGSSGSGKQPRQQQGASLAGSGRKRFGQRLPATRQVPVDRPGRWRAPARRGRGSASRAIEQRGLQLICRGMFGIGEPGGFSLGGADRQGCRAGLVRMLWRASASAGAASRRRCACH